MSKDLLTSLNIFRLWVSGGVLYNLILLWRLTNYPGGLGFFWGSSSFRTPETSLYVALLISGLGLLWTKRYTFGSLLILILISFHRGLNPSLYWGWIWVFCPLLFFRLLSFRLTSEVFKKISYSLYLFYILSIYWIPSLDRMTFPDWFNGRIFSVFISSIPFARFPFVVPQAWDKFFIPITVSIFLVEFIAPLCFLFFPHKKIFSKLMIGFHVMLMILSDVQFWNPMMMLIWVDQLFHAQMTSPKSKIVIFLLLLPLSFFSFIWGREYYVKASSHPLSRAFKVIGLESFSSMKMFSNPKIPVLISHRTIYSSGGKEFEIPPELATPLRGVFTHRSSKVDLSVVCDRDNPAPVKLSFFVEAREEGKSEKVLNENCYSSKK